MEHIIIIKAGQYSPSDRKVNQDSSINMIKKISDQQIGFFGVFDGHGEYGEQVSNYVKENLQKYLLFKLKNTQNIISILNECFDSVSNDLLRNNQINTYLSGTTAVTVFIQGNKIYCSNCGDSRAILAKFNQKDYHPIWKNINLSNDHKPNLKLEKKRILQNGGRVELQIDENEQNIGIYRVWNQSLTYPGLAMSRSLGDKAGREVGVISVPEILQFDIGEDDKFIVIASDGVWEFLSNEQVVDIVAPFYKNNNINGAAESLIKQSVKQWQENDDVIDDITCVILFI
ncbi:protein phosphatase 2c, putative, partial [Ichthyophthirius multifiliis]